MENQNRRRHQRRQSADKLFVQVVFCEAEATLNHQTFVCHTQDISRSGLQLNISQLLPQGTLIDLWLDNKALGKKCFLSGEILWSREDDSAESSAERYLHGVKLHQPVFSDTQEWQRIFDTF